MNLISDLKQLHCQTIVVGEYYETTGTDITKYYGKTAMRKDGALTYLLADHLGSNS